MFSSRQSKKLNIANYREDKRLSIARIWLINWLHSRLKKIKTLFIVNVTKVTDDET
jgi:hypothetical protein